MALHGSPLTAVLFGSLALAGCLAASPRGSLDTAGGREATATLDAPAAPTRHLSEDGGARDAAVVTPDLLGDLEALPPVPARASFCGRGYQDPASTKLCAADAPSSLGELLSILDLDFENAVGNGELGNPAFALLSHSTSLTGNLVSPINPRVFLFTRPATEGPIPGPAKADPSFMALAFVRGEPLVEIVSRDRASGVLRFLLVRYGLGCEETSCENWDLFGPEVERGWTSASYFADDDLENTIFDCNACHREGGPSGEKRLLMMQQRAPWTHFFRDNEAGKQILASYFQAHPKTETYGGIPGRLVSWSEPALLEGLVENEGFIEQPLELPTVQLARAEMRRADPALVADYAELSARAARGDSIPIPHAAAFFVTPARLAAASKAYRDALLDPGARDAAPDLAELHGDDALRSTQRRAPEGATGAELLVGACARCHNDRLDPELSRARFDPKRLSTMTRAELETVRDRVDRPHGDPLAMPPERFVSWSEEERGRVRTLLSQLTASAR